MDQKAQSSKSTANVKLVGKIEANIVELDKRVELITAKMSDIKKIILDLQSKKSLYTKDDPLKELNFQILLLNNDRNYLNNIKKHFTTKINEDFFELSGEIVLLVSSMASIDFRHTEDDDTIIKKIVNLKKTPEAISNLKCMNELIESISINLALIEEFLQDFNNYINTMKNKVTNEIYHCSGLYPELYFRHQSINLEYQKYIRKLDNLMEYYYELSNAAIAQSSCMKIADYCGSTKLKTPENSPITL